MNSSHQVLKFSEGKLFACSCGHHGFFWFKSLKGVLVTVPLSTPGDATVETPQKFKKPVFYKNVKERFLQDCV